MNILVVSSYLPYPLFSGGQVRLYNLLKKMAQKHTVTLVCEIRRNQAQSDIAEVKKFCNNVIVFPRKKQWSIVNIVKTGFSSDPFLLIGHTLPDMKVAIEHLLAKEKFDLIHAETFYIVQNIPKTTIPLVVVEHNIEYLVYQRYMDTAPFFMKPFLRIDVAKMQKKEEAVWKRADKLVAVSEYEKKIMNRDDVVVVPNGVDTRQFTLKKKKTTEKTVLFIGDFAWMQNRDSARFIIEKIWPVFLDKINKKIFIKLWIVGRHMPDDIKQLATHKSIVIDEHAPKNTTEIFQQSDVLLAPIRVGGGTSYKIIEAMASGVPVLTTSLGKAGLPVADKKEILIADTVSETVAKMVAVLSDQKMYEQIALNARKVIEKEFDWDSIAEKLEKVYRSI